MKAACIGGGPGGLLSAILLKKNDPANEVVVFERNALDDTFGFGVVFSQETLDNIAAADPETFAEIEARFRRWSAMDVDVLGHKERSDGHAFAALARKEMLHILAERARDLGVDLRHSTIAPPLAELEASYDVVIASDGVNSKTRAQLAANSPTIQPDISKRPSKYIWFGTTQRFDCFTFIFIDTAYGRFWAHIYPFNATTSTFIVETDPDTWKRAGLDEFAAEERAHGVTDERSLRFCEELFADHLGGEPLIGNGSNWLNFTLVRNEHWFAGNTVLIGDAAHTAHFSIGSGTKLALEDAIAVTDALINNETVDAALTAYDTARRPVVASLQRSAQTSMEWFEGIARYNGLAPEQFVFQLLTRSQRITYDNLKLRDANYLKSLDKWLLDDVRASGLDVADGTPPMFTPFTIGGLTLQNRIVVSPMAQYMAVEGMPTPWHMVHLGSRAVGGAGLVMTEMTCTSADARITPGCPGIWNADQAAEWAKIVDFVHSSSEAKIGLQIGHAGRKGSTNVMWEGIDSPLADGNWPLVSASPIPFRPDSQVPAELTVDQMTTIINDHVHSAQLGAEAGFDLLELHFAHGYLLASFISPVTNQRTDEFGGDLAARMTFPLQLLRAARAAWPADRPLSVRISAHDWVDGGITGDDAVEIARMLHANGADIIDVSTGQTSKDARPAYGRLYQTPFSDRIRHEAQVPTMTVGAVSSIDDANTIIAAGRADLCLLARPHLVDPYWTLNAAIDQGFRGHKVPDPYLSGMSARRRAQQP